jgi:hypothetical protein
MNVYVKVNLNLQYGWKHTMGEPRLLSHCIAFQGYHIWTSIMSLSWRIFTMFLHIMVSQNQKKSNAKETTIFLFHVMWCLKLYAQKKCTSQCFKKCKKWLKCFLIFMKCQNKGIYLGYPMFNFQFMWGWFEWIGFNISNECTFT